MGKRKKQQVVDDDEEFQIEEPEQVEEVEEEEEEEEIAAKSENEEEDEDAAEGDNSDDDEATGSEDDQPIAKRAKQNTGKWFNHFRAIGGPRGDSHGGRGARLQGRCRPSFAHGSQSLLPLALAFHVEGRVTRGQTTPEKKSSMKKATGESFTSPRGPHSLSQASPERIACSYSVPADMALKLSSTRTIPAQARRSPSASPLMLRLWTTRPSLRTRVLLSLTSSASS